MKLIKINDVVDIMEKLSKRFDAFFSEQHFVFEFTLELKSKFHNANIIHEYRFEDSINTFEIDVLALLENNKYVFEFKYRTAESSRPINIYDLPNQLKNQGACDFGCFDCWSDIERNEYLLREKCFCKNSFFIFLTNDSCYYDGINKSGRPVRYSIFNDFLMTNGYKKNNHKISGSPTKESIGRKRYNHNLRALREIRLNNQYLFEYKPFGKEGFKYLLLDGQNTTNKRSSNNEK